VNYQIVDFVFMEALKDLIMGLYAGAPVIAEKKNDLFTICYSVNIFHVR